MIDNFLRQLAQKLRRKTGVSGVGRRRRGENRKFPGLYVELLEERTLLSTFQWVGGGFTQNWADGSNWILIGTGSGSYPQTSSDVAQFTGSPAVNASNVSAVTLNSAITVGEIDFGTSASIIISTPNNSVLTIDGNGTTTKSGLNALSINTGMDQINVPLNAPGLPLAATVSGGTLQLGNPSGIVTNSIIAGSSFAVNNGGTLSVVDPSQTDLANITVNNGGTLSVSAAVTLAPISNPSAATRLTVNSGGSVAVNDSPKTFGRFNPNAGSSIVLNGGNLTYVGASNAASNDRLPTIDLNSGSSTIDTFNTGATGTVTLTSSSLVRQAGATVTFLGSQTGSGSEDLDTPANTFSFTTAPTTYGNNGGIIPYATVINNDFGDFATYDTANGSIAAFTAYVSSIALAGPGDTVKESTPETLTSSKTINGLLLTGAGAVSEAGNTLTIATGAMLNTSTSGGTISGGALLFNPVGTGATGSGEGIIISPAVGGAAASFYNLGFRPAANIPANVSATTITGPTQIPYNMTPTSTRIDPSLNYPIATGLTGSSGAGPLATLPAGTQNGDVAAQWTSTLNIVTGGTYTFSMTIFDGAYLYIDGNPVFAAGNNGTGPAAVSLPVTLTAGLHTLRETYDHAVTSATNIVAYSGPDTAVNGTATTVVLAGGNNPLQPGLTTSAVTTIGSVIIGGIASVTVGGTGTLILPTANTYGGTTFLDGGTLIVGSNTSLGSSTLSLASGALQSSAAVTLANPFTLNDGSVTIGGVNNITLTNTGTLSDTLAGTTSTPSGGTNTLTISNAGLTTITGKLVDGATSGSLTVAGGTQIAIPFAGVAAGTGNLVLGGSAASTYSGGTVLANGSLILASSSALGAGTVTLVSGTLMSDASLRTLANPIVLDGNVTLSASSANGTSSTSSGLTFNGPVAVAANSSLTVGDTVVFNGIVSGTGQLTVAGLGSLTMANLGNTYSGGTVLNAGSLNATGTLIVADSNGTTGGALASGSLGIGPLTLINGTLQASATAGVTIANTLNLGGGYVAFSGANYINFNQTAITTLTPVNNVMGTANLIANATNASGSGIPASTTTIADQLSGTGNLTLFGGSGTLALTGTDVFGGATTVNGGTLSLSGASGSLSGTSQITVNVGGVLTVDDTGTFVANRLDNGSLQMEGGTLNILGGSSGAQESLGVVNLLGGNSTIRLNAPTSTANLSIGSLSKASAGATIGFLAGANQKFGVADQITFGGSPLPFGGNVIPYATVTDATTSVLVGATPTTNSGGYNLATVNNSTQLVALTNYQALSTTGGNSSTDNVLVNATPSTPIATDTVNALLVIGDGINVTGAGRDLECRQWPGGQQRYGDQQPRWQHRLGADSGFWRGRRSHPWQCRLAHDKQHHRRNGWANVGRRRQHDTAHTQQLHGGLEQSANHNCQSAAFGRCANGGHLPTCLQWLNDGRPWIHRDSRTSANSALGSPHRWRQQRSSHGRIQRLIREHLHCAISELTGRVGPARVDGGIQCAQQWPRRRQRSNHRCRDDNDRPAGDHL